MRGKIVLAIKEHRARAATVMSRRIALALALTVTAAFPWGPCEKALAQHGERTFNPQVEQSLRQAHVLVRQGQPDRAIELLAPLVQQYPDDTQLITALATALLENRQPDRAAEILARAAERQERDDLDLEMLLARARKEMGAGREAALGLLDCIRAQPLWGGRLRDTFEILVGDSLAGQAAMRAIEEAAAPNSAPRAWREMLVHLHVITGQGERALAAIGSLDRELHAAGRMFLTLAKQLDERGSPELALAALDSTVARSRDRQTLAEGWYQRGLLLEELKRVEESAAAFARVESLDVSSARALQAALRRAQLLLSTPGRGDDARTAYESIVRRVDAVRPSAETRAARETALFGIAECALRRHDFMQAAERYSELERVAPGTARERAGYERAEMLFYAGRMEDAENAFYAMIDSFPTGEWTNDALSRVLLLGEHAQARENLTRFAALAFLHRIGRPDSALAIARNTLAGDAGLMRDDFRAAEIALLIERGRFTEADSSLSRMLADDGASRLTPDAILLVAQRFAAEADRRPRAAEWYEVLAVRYPTSLAARRARQLRAAMRAEGEPS